MEHGSHVLALTCLEAAEPRGRGVQGVTRPVVLPTSCHPVHGPTFEQLLGLWQVRLQIKHAPSVMGVQDELAAGRLGDADDSVVSGAELFAECGQAVPLGPGVQALVVEVVDDDQVVLGVCYDQ